MAIIYKNKLDETFKNTASKKEWEIKLNNLISKLSAQPILSIKLNNYYLTSLEQLKQVLVSMPITEVMQSIISIEINN